MVHVDLHLLVVVPRVAALLSGSAEVELFFLKLLGARVVMGRREHDVHRVVLVERARRLAVPGRDPAHVAGHQVEIVDLVERVSRLALALEDHPGAVGREIPLAGAGALERQPAHPRQEILLRVALSFESLGGERQQYY